ncbi:MAG: phosphatidate cytidylyltransferase [Flavobacteriales bacterium]|nr:phosphatidate cytidylyltransferase [Flavobacteriales bacterium]
MSQDLIHTLQLAVVFLVLFGSAEILYHKLKLRAEITRKYVHVSTGLITMSFPSMIDNHWYVMALCGSFLLLLLFSLPLKILPSINAVQRTTRGSLLFPIVVYVCFWVSSETSQFVYYYVPILILGISDPLAALVGKKWPLLPFTTFGYTKTITGSSAFFMSSFFIAFLLLQYHTQLSLSVILLIASFTALGSTLLEAVSHKGYDNMSIPFSALGILLLFNQYVGL